MIQILHFTLYISAVKGLEKPMRKIGRPSIVSDEIITAAKAIAFERDICKNSFSSSVEVLSAIEVLRKDEIDVQGGNRLANLPQMSENTARKLVKLVTPVTLSNGGVQNTSRQNALLDARNAISCASVYAAVSEGIKNGKFVHSWDEVSIELNSFDKYVELRMTEEGKRNLASRNLHPATTEMSEQRRMLKIGLSKLT